MGINNLILRYRAHRHTGVVNNPSYCKIYRKTHTQPINNTNANNKSKGALAGQTQAGHGAMP